VGHVLAVKCTELLEVDGPVGPARKSAGQLAAVVPAEQWITCTAGHGAKGRRLFDWTASSWPSRRPPGWPGGCWCAAAQSDGELAFSACYGPATTPLLGLLPLTVPEVRRLLVALVWTIPVEPGFVLAWSRWRRRQARARRAHHHRSERRRRGSPSAAPCRRGFR
jgi:hypothetical protein